MNYGLHIIDFPSGRFGFVGSIPTSLATKAPADRSDVMGGRAFKDEDGELKTWKFPAFDTAAEAIAFAESKGAELCDSPTCMCARLRKEGAA